jgi:SAM-dependent methyltransferase
MSWLAFWRRKRAPEDQAQPAATNRHVGGRLFAPGVPYLLPSDLGENQRLDFQHYMLRFTLKGNYAAPLKAPRDILDVGCGTGRWAMEMAQQFPSARVIGVDVTSGASGGQPAQPQPANWSFTPANVLEGLPFPDNSFDFVHQRLLVAAIPAERWPQVVAELARVTRPGGWVELVEAESRLPNAGPGLQASMKWASGFAARRGIDPASASQVGAFLTQAGLAHVNMRTVALPVGDRAGRIGIMAKTDLLAGMTALRGIVISMGLVSESEFDTIYQQAQAELSSGRIVWPFYIAYGQKPAGAR